ncbi:MAG: cadmium-translocating P-type ATPase [Gammaproteobacteria bacterium]|nr:cadmium-translocating P-type ATPase [Gammaproteobacteria bacterium]
MAEPTDRAVARQLPSSPRGPANPRVLDIEIEGMTCAACVARLERVLGNAPGVVEAQVNLALARAAVSLDENALDAAQIAEVVARAGFSATTDQTTYPVEGMTCAACAARVERAIRAEPGVVDAEVNLALERATVTTLSGTVTGEALAARVADAGYRLAVDAGDEAGERERAERESRRIDSERRVVVAAALMTLPMVVGMIFQAFGIEELHLMPAGEVLLATPIQFILGARFYRGAFNALRGGGANMDVLVVLGTTAAYFYSWYLLTVLGEAADGQLYFEASAVIITLVLLGKHLESRARRATTSAIRELMDLRPAVARVRSPDGAEVDKPLSQVVRGDVVLVRPGERIAVDGDVVAGASEVDESVISGESMPVPKVPGDEVTGGAVNVHGYLEVRATTVGEESALTRIIRLVEDAQRGKAALQRLVDRISGIFVPVVVALSACTFLGWLFATGNAGAALVAAVSVLVIACPCALGLATPTAVMTGTGAAARRGILFRDIDALERVHAVDTVIFDKTGTLTEGTARVEDIAVLGELQCQAGGAAAEAQEEELLRLVAGVQRASEHPLAAAIGRLAEECSVTPALATDFQNAVGQGVAAQVEGRTVRVGNAEFALAGAAVPSTPFDPATHTLVWAADERGPLGVFAIADPLRQQSAQAIERLKAIGVEPVLLSGDSTAIVRRIGDGVGIAEARGGVKPEGKAQEVAARQQRGECVAMIGDGVNDAPALAAADVGVAIGSGADVAMETAGVTLMRPDPMLVPEAIAASRATVRKIRQNLFWAFIYNIIGIPAAMLGYLSPTLAGAAMALSSACVTGNSLLLRRSLRRSAIPRCTSTC